MGVVRGNQDAMGEPTRLVSRPGGRAPRPSGRVRAGRLALRGRPSELRKLADGFIAMKGQREQQLRMEVRLGLKDVQARSSPPLERVTIIDHWAKQIPLGPWSRPLVPSLNAIENERTFQVRKRRRPS
jgi:hypothetical protein